MLRAPVPEQAAYWAGLQAGVAPGGSECPASVARGPSSAPTRARFANHSAQIPDPRGHPPFSHCTPGIILYSWKTDSPDFLLLPPPPIDVDV